MSSEKSMYNMSDTLVRFWHIWIRHRGIQKFWVNFLFLYYKQGKLGRQQIKGIVVRFPNWLKKIWLVQRETKVNLDV